MKIYHYDQDTGRYICSTEAILDPLEWELNKVERWILPAHATFDALPECPEGKMIVMDDGWKIVGIPAPREPDAAVAPTAEELEAQRVEGLIQAKIRQQAIEALQSEGKL